MLRYGKQLHKIITDAIEGDDAAEFGAKIFDLGDEGVNFKIKCEQQGDYPTYVSSRFTAAGKLNLSEDAQKELYGQTHTLKETFPAKSTDELNTMLNEHFHCKADEPKVETPAAGDTPHWSAPAEAAPAAAAPTPAPPEATTSVEDDIDDLLADL